MLTHKDLRQKIEEMERKYDAQFKIVFETIKKLIDPPQKPKTFIGFTPPSKPHKPGFCPAVRQVGGTKFARRAPRAKSLKEILRSRQG